MLACDENDTSCGYLVTSMSHVDQFACPILSGICDRRINRHGLKLKPKLVNCMKTGHRLIIYDK